MYMKVKDKWLDSFDLGDKAENAFMKIAKSNGLEISESSRHENMRKHIDYWVWKPDSKDKKWSVDVKSRKRTNRKDKSVQDDLVWLEFQNVNGNKGWLYGEADVIAFERADDFILVNRKTLVEAAEKLVDQNTLVNSANKAKYNLYKRFDRDDRVSMVEMKDILALKHKKWDK